MTPLERHVTEQKIHGLAIIMSANRDCDEVFRMDHDRNNLLDIENRSVGC